MEDKKLSDVIDTYGNIVELIVTEPNIKVNKYGYKLMGYLYKDKEKPLVFDGKSCIMMSVEEFINFSRERKLQFILKG